MKDASATAEVLLRYDANVNAKDNAGWTPLLVAAVMDTSSATAAVLGRYGAEQSTRRGRGR